MVKIIHISDWHGQWVNLEEADLYILTGDMLPNFPHLTRNYTIKFKNESHHQTEWMKKRLPSPRTLLGSPKAPVVIVRGNHDFIDIGSYFGGEVFEVDGNSSRTITYCGLKIGGFRGIPPLGGTWCDELEQVERLSRVTALPQDLDIVVSHPPPQGILSADWGCSEYAWLVEQWGLENRGPKLCCFGHIHERGGQVIEKDGIKFSNAACAINEIEL